MIKVLFVCHGNICRSPMAEFLFKKLVKDKGLEDCFEIASAATSTEEIGNPIHYGTRRILDRFGIDYSKKRAYQITRSDVQYYDYIIGMDQYNLRNLERMFGKNNKFSLLLDYPKLYRDVLDPWYTGDFNSTYNDIDLGINAFYDYLKINNKI